MSKKHKEREANFLANANGGADLTGAVEELPTETTTVETAEAEEILTTDAEVAVALIDAMVAEEAIEESVAEAIAETETVGEVALVMSGEAAPDAIAPDEAQPPVEAPIDPPQQVTGPVDPPPADAPSAAMAQIDALRAQIEALKGAKNSRKVASGSKPRPNVTYTLLAKPPQWSATPQVAQLQQILFNPAFLDAHRGADGVVKVDEPTLFAAVVAGKEAGVLRTKQEAVRILQYYRSNLLTANCLRWA